MAAAGHRRGTAGSILWWWLGATALYVSLVPFSWPQLAAGAAVAAAAVGLARQALHAAGLNATGAAPHVWRLGGIATAMGTELRDVALAVARQLRGRGPVRGRFVAFRPGETISPSVDAAFTFEASLSPNTYVVAVVDDEEDRDVVLTHQLVPRPHVRSSFPRWRQ